MKTVICTLKSTSPYSQGRYHMTAEKPKEGKADYEIRTWREKMHYVPETGQVLIPPIEELIRFEQPYIAYELSNFCKN